MRIFGGKPVARRRMREDFICESSFLLRNSPVYVRYFSSTTLGAIYRVLLSKAYREELKEFYEKKLYNVKWREVIAERYSKGVISTFIKVEELAENTGFTPTTIRNTLAQLVNLNLISIESYKTKEVRDGKIIQIGSRLFYKTEHGFEIAREEEEFSIDRWDDWFKEDKEKFEKWLLEKCSDKNLSLEPHEKIFSSTQKNIFVSQNSSSSRDPQENMGVTDDTSGGIINNNINTSLTREEVLQKAINEILQSEKIREVLRLTAEVKSHFNLTTEQTNAILLRRKEMKNALFPQLPRTSLVLSEEDVSNYERLNRVYNYYKDSKDTKQFVDNAVLFIGRLWEAIAADVTGVYQYYSTDKSTYSKNYKKMLAVTKKLVNIYSPNQIIWTLKHILQTKSDLDFLVKDITTLKSLVDKYSKDFQTINTQLQQVHQQQVAQENWQNQRQEEMKKVVNSTQSGDKSNIHYQRLLQMAKEIE